MNGQAPGPGRASSVDPAVVDLLGLIAYGQLSGFSRLGADAEMAPKQPQKKAAVARMAVEQFGRYEQLERRLIEVGVPPPEAMLPFVDIVDSFHDRTRPSDWHEGLVKAYVGDWIAQDFYREIAAYVDADTRAFVTRLLDREPPAFLIAELRQAAQADSRLAARLALWGRRLVGETITQAQRVAMERETLASILVGGLGHGADLAELGRMFARLEDAHTIRMGHLGLTA